MTRRPIAALVITALLGAQPGTGAFAQEVAKSLPSGPVGTPSAPSIQSLGASLPSIRLDLPSTSLSQPGLEAGISVPQLRQGGDVQAPQQSPLPALPGAQSASLSLHSAEAFSASAHQASLPEAVNPEAPRQARGFSIWRGLTGLVSSFGKKAEKPSQADSGAALDGFFDGPAPKDARVFLTENGREPESIALSELKAKLAADPRYAAKLSKSGRVRVVLASENGALSQRDVPALEAKLKDAGASSSRLSVEKILVRAPQADGAAAGDWTSPSKSEPFWKKALLAAPRELAYLGRTFKASITRPSVSEVVGGLASKGPAFGMSVAWYAKLMLPVHLGPFGAAILFSFTLETFHGIFINTWQNLQNAIGRQRGVTYQTFFNLAYMQLTAGIARVITWMAIPATIAPWQLAYWRDMGVVTFVGTFIGTLGFQGLNDLYNKGWIGRGTRSAIQQGRDLFFLLAGVFFASGSMGIFWPIFIAQQTLDLGLFLISHFAKARPIAYVADAGVAASPEFKSMYPVTPGPRPSPLRQALDALTGNPLARLISWPFRKGWELLKGGKR